MRRIGTEDQPLFIPAETTPEAIARIFALTGAGAQTRGEKRALIALRDALGLDVDVVRTNAVLGEHLAVAMDIAWDPEAYTDRTRITLEGLNALLAGAHDAYQVNELAPVASVPPSTLVGPGWSAFRPAKSKIEAVTRIAALTHAPSEWLGPGSKEHKSVLVNLADRLVPEARLDRSSKTRMARDLAHHFGAGWSDDCYSTGETISLKGLNTVLAGAERRLNLLGASTSDLMSSAEEEGAALAAALHDGWTAEPWDGRQACEWMRQSGVRGANENEWQGWYFEARGREILNEAFTPPSNPPRSRYGNTVFDYRLRRVWDLKAHSEEKFFFSTGNVTRAAPRIILNDTQAIRDCVAEQGLGLLVLSGQADMDEHGSFVEWHRNFKAKQGISPSASNSGRSRMRKKAFTPLFVEAYWIANTAALDAALVAGQLVVRAQGRQAPRTPNDVGAPRAEKIHMHVDIARKDLLISRRNW